MGAYPVEAIDVVEKGLSVCQSAVAIGRGVVDPEIAVEFAEPCSVDPCRSVAVAVKDFDVVATDRGIGAAAEGPYITLLSDESGFGTDPDVIGCIQPKRSQR